MRYAWRMKILLASVAVVFATTLCLLATDSAAEKAFVEKFKAAYEANEKATLESFLYKEGAHPKALEWFRMMVVDGAGGKVTRIELVDLSPEELKMAEGTQEGPDGEKVMIPLNPTKKLKLTTTSKDGESAGSSSSAPLVAEKDGKFVIPVPVPAK